MPLTLSAIRTAAPGPKGRKLADSNSLYLFVSPKGAKSFRIDYQHGGKRNTFTIGQWPEVDLNEARRRAAEIKSQLKAGHDPAQVRNAEKLAPSGVVPGERFDDLAALVIEDMQAKRRAANTITRAEWMRRLAAPVIGNRPVGAITPEECFRLVKGVERSGRRETAARLRRFLDDVFVYAVALGRADRNPAEKLARTLVAPVRKQRAAITDTKPLGALLTSVDAYHGQPSTALGVKLLALTFVRPGELRFAEWSEIDFRARRWTVPASRMKMRREHIVPLSVQALQILAGLQVLAKGSRYVFPALHSRERPVSENTWNMALRRMGIDQAEACAHGFRSTASTMLHAARDENGQRLFSEDAVELQLAHASEDRVRATYDRGLLIEERTRLMQWWSDRLDEIRAADPLFIEACGVEDVVPRALFEAQLNGGANTRD